MDLIHALQGLKDLIRKSETETALDELAKLLEQVDTDLLDEAFALQQQMSLCQQNIRLNLIDHKEYSISFSNISFSALRLITVASKKLQTNQQSAIPSAGRAIEESQVPSAASPASGELADLLQTGVQKMQAEDFAGAMNDLTTYLEKNPESWEVKQHLAELHELLGLWDEAIHWYSETIRQNPKQPVALNSRGNIQMEQMGAFDKAYNDFNAAVLVGPHLTAAQFNRALAAMHLGDYTRAVSDLDACIKKGFETLTSTGLRGVCRVHTGDYEGSMSDLEIALKDEPENASYWGSYGLCKYHLGDYAGAIDLIGKGLAFDPSQLEMQTVRGISYYFLENYDAAEADFKAAIQQDPQYGYAWFYLGLVHKMRGDYKNAVECLQESYTHEPELADAYAIMGVIAFEQDQFDEAIQFCEHALQLDPNNEVAIEFLQKAQKSKSSGWFGNIFGS